ncbi:hypothetical protein HDU86_000937 [Geranomyces michiganensis]|nr:hypothetical protein HDU86_000937 [Geranomyces michiganensis]
MRVNNRSSTLEQTPSRAPPAYSNAAHELFILGNANREILFARRAVHPFTFGAPDMSAWYDSEQEEGIRARLSGADRVSVDVGDIAESNGMIYGWKLGDAQDGSDRILLYPWIILAEKDIDARTLAKERGMVVMFS